MQHYELAATLSSPEVILDPASGVMRIRGESYPENTFDFYRPILSWIKTFLANETPAACLDLELVYLNTGSIKCLMDIFDLFEEAHQRDRQVSVCWRYHSKNPRSLETAEEFREDVTFPFSIEMINHE